MTAKTNRIRNLIAIATGGCFILSSLLPSVGDEGMWLFSNPPRTYLREKHQFEVSDPWLLHLQKASVRFNSGGSASFVSEDGLIMSNHHVGRGAIQKLSNSQHNYVRDGFQAKIPAQELPCRDLELNVLQDIEDVTERVEGSVERGSSPETAFQARRATIAKIEELSLKTTGLRSDVVTLYQGAKYHLYRYKRYTDVRLVFAPEEQIAFFGGDPDNFEYPRFNLDICFFRAYENGRPAKIQDYLTWSKTGPQENDLIFVSGHPGRTDRLLTMAELEYLRDVTFPMQLARLYRCESMLTAWGSRSAENQRKAKNDLMGIQNGRKAREGGLAGLLDPTFLKAKILQENRLKEAARNDSKFSAATNAWDQIAEARKVVAREARRHAMLEAGWGFWSDLFGVAKTLVRYEAESSKPNGDRLPEFRESSKTSLELQLFSPKPIYPDYEQAKLAHSLTFLAESLGYSDPLVTSILAGKSPQERASELVRETSLLDVAERKRLYQGAPTAIRDSSDSMIRLARLIDPESRALRKTLETQDEILKQAHSRIAEVRFATEGTDSYPDATFTLRLSPGIVKGYDANGVRIPHQTTFAGLYDRWAEQKGRVPFDLPARWVERKPKLNLATPFNFISTADIIGGNSGSPVVNRHGELVGIIFDGNLPSLVLDFAYSDKEARAVAVHSQGILESLRKIYQANWLADELQGKRQLKRK